MIRYITLPFICLYLLISGCSQSMVQSIPSPIEVSSTAKSVPLRNKIPPTQKPYHVLGRTYYPVPSSFGHNETGIASWYGPTFHGKKTSNGEVYDMYSTTAAHKTLPMNTFLLVKNLENGRETIVRINDRGPFVKGRIIDLSLTSAKELAMDQRGTARVQITALGEAEQTSRGGGTVERFLPYDFTHGEYFVQIGAFTDSNNANRLKEIMLKQGRKAISQTYTVDDKKFYRVQVRAGKELDAAKKMEKLLSAEFPEAFVIAR
nr:septal ring lytic transglycosylase RlpA family protein [Desulfobulbaceae bacterium]